MIEFVFARDGYDLEGVNEEGFIFLHIHLSKFTPSILRDLKISVELARQYALRKKHVAIFATTESEMMMRMWGKISPTYTLQKLDEVTWMASWLTEEI